MTENIELLDNLIVGYVPHSIYAFSTPQLINYLKVGETSRSVNVRLLEWKRKIFDLQLKKEWLAMVPKDNPKDFFQDHALHKYFKDSGIKPLNSKEAPGNSKEFYPVTIFDVEKGLQKISEDYHSEPPRYYNYFSIEDHSQIQEHWTRTEDFSPRKNQ